MSIVPGVWLIDCGAFACILVCVHYWILPWRAVRAAMQISQEFARIKLNPFATVLVCWRYIRNISPSENQCVYLECDVLLFYYLDREAPSLKMGSVCVVVFCLLCVRVLPILHFGCWLVRGLITHCLLSHTLFIGWLDYRPSLFSLE